MNELYFGDCHDMIEGKEIKMTGGVDASTFKQSVKDVRPEIKEKGMFD